MIKKLLLSLVISFSLPTLVSSQVSKKIIVEHFTNTWCSTCANRNPGFYANLANQTNVIHLAIHPSSPYPGCILNQHNVSENDGRTNYYNVYGSTPRLVIQGNVISSSANYSSSAIFTPYIGQTTPASIRIDQIKYGIDSIHAKIVITTASNHNLGNLRLFAALAEDTVFYTGPNGEPKHYDVFRKSLSGVQGTAVNLPATVGDSIVLTYSSASNSAWDFSRIFSLAILQNETDKSVIQAQAAGSDDGIFTSINISNKKRLIVYPNPAGDILHINSGTEKESQYFVYNILGKLLLSGFSSDESKIDISDLYSGHYFIRIINDKNTFTRSFIKH